MAAPVTSAARKMLVEQGPVAVLRYVARCGGVVQAAFKSGSHRTTLSGVVREAREETGQDWRDFLRVEGDDDEPAETTGRPSILEPRDAAVPTVIVPRKTSPEDDPRFEPDKVDADIEKGDAEAMAAVPVPEEEQVAVAEEMAAKEDEEEQAPNLPPSAFIDDIPRKQFGRLRVPDAVRPGDDSSPREWFEYLTVVSEFKEMVPEVRLRVADDRNYAALIPVADIHAGKQGCRFAKCRALAEWGAGRGGYYFAGLGDWVNCPTLKSPEADQLGKQICGVGAATAALYWLWKPLADGGQLLGIADGNHELRIAKATGQDDISPMRYLAERLNVPYWGYETPLMLRIGEQLYCYYFNHGTGGGQTLGYIVATLERMSWNNDAEAIIMAHRHMKIAVERAKYGPEQVDVGFEWQAKFRWLVCCGCMCESVASEWSRQKNLPPAVSGTVTLRAYANKRDVHARA